MTTVRVCFLFFLYILYPSTTAEYRLVLNNVQFYRLMPSFKSEMTTAREDEALQECHTPSGTRRTTTLPGILKEGLGTKKETANRSHSYVPTVENALLVLHCEESGVGNVATGIAVLV